MVAPGARRYAALASTDSVRYAREQEAHALALDAQHAAKAKAACEAESAEEAAELARRQRRDAAGAQKENASGRPARVATHAEKARLRHNGQGRGKAAQTVAKKKKTADSAAAPQNQQEKESFEVESLVDSRTSADQGCARFTFDHRAANIMGAGIL